MDWKVFITEIGPTEYWGPFTFREPASFGDIVALEAEFDLLVPLDLRELLLQTNGVFDRYGCSLIDSIDRIFETNRLARSDTYDGYMPMDHLLAFSNKPGNGDWICYGYPRAPDGRHHIFRWDHEDDSRNWEAPDLKTWFEWEFARARQEQDGN